MSEKEILTGINLFKRERHGILLDTKELEKKDDFEPNRAIEFSILTFMMLFFVPSLILYIKHKDHILIKYRQPVSVIIGGILATINATCVPIIRALKLWCLFNMILSYVIFSYVIITLSRFIRIFYIQRLSIFKLKFSEKKNKNIHEKGEKVLKKIESKISKNIKSFPIKSSGSDNIDSFSNEEIKIGDFKISDPNHYFNKLNSIINKKITIYYVIFPVTALIIYYVILSLKDWENLKTRCINERIKMSVPKLILNLVVIIHSIYMIYQAFYKQKWDKELRKEYVAFVIVIIFCSIFMSLTMNSVFGDIVFKYRIYIFQMITMTVHVMCVIDPLINIFIHSKKKQKLVLTEEEFLLRLTDTNFKEQVKDITTQTFCIENLLFFEAHYDLMNIIIKYYNKKNGIPIQENGYSSTDILHKTKLNPILYEPFDPIFIPQFEQIYNLYIKEDSIALINIESSTAHSIEDQIMNDKYSYLMFYDAAQEVGNLLYSNVCPRMRL